MKIFPFTKVEAIGNNFVLIDALGISEPDWSSLAVGMCAHRFGIGSDGLLALLPSQKADFKMRMFNPDGTEDACGNGLLCAAVYIRAIGLSAKKELTIEAKDGLHGVEISRTLTARVNLGRPSLRPADIPADSDADRLFDHPLELGGGTQRITAVTVGTPHAVICAPSESFWTAIPEVSREIETHPLFPERVNVTWCSSESPGSLRIRTWERGVGPTLGCGTGACAALAAANLHGIVETSACVTSPGGTLYVEWPDRGDIFISGTANIVYSGEYHAPLRIAAAR